MRCKGAKDVPNVLESDTNLPQMFSAVYSQVKTGGMKNDGCGDFLPDQIRTVSTRCDGENLKCNGEMVKGRRVRNMPGHHSEEWSSR
jgi:hypothetical protein